MTETATDKTWWDAHASSAWDRAVGGPDAITRVRMRELVVAGGCRSVLDVGCGRAVDAEPLDAAGVDYVGAELTERFVNDCRARGVNVHHRPSHDLPGGLFDAVVCRHVLEHLIDPQPTLRAMVAAANRMLVIVLAVPPGMENRLSYDPDRRLHWNIWGHPVYQSIFGNSVRVASWSMELVESGQGHSGGDESIVTVNLK